MRRYDREGYTGAGEIQFVVTPSRAEWQLGTVNVSLDSFQLRRLLPAAWAGLRGSDLVRVTSVSDAVFCHAKRLIAITGSREGAMALLRQALDTSGVSHTELGAS